MQHKFWFEEERNIVRVQFVGQITGDEYTEFADWLNTIPAKNRMRYIIDVSRIQMNLSNMGKLKDRKDLADKTNKIPGSLLTIVGASPMIRMLGKAFVRLLGKTNDTAFFKTEKEARKWLDENMPPYRIVQLLGLY